MLVVISDIHFVDGTAGEHNLPYSAFESVFLSDIASLAKEKKAKELKILLLGDIVDVTRSAQWLDINLDDRPWGTNGLLDIPKPKPGSNTEKQALKILGIVPDDTLSSLKSPESLDKDTILGKNWETFKFFREFKQHLQIDVPLEIIYIPGNHDRVCNLYPSIRNELRRILGLTINSYTVAGDPNGEWRYRYSFTDEAYGVFARHGHQYDIYNYGGRNDFTTDSHLKVPIGDVFTTEFAVKIPWMVSKLKSKYPEISDELIKHLKDIDNVRPLTGILEWIYYRIKREDSGQIRKALNEALKNVIEELLDNEFVQKWRSPETHVDEVLRAISSHWLSWLPKTILERLETEDMLPLIMGMTGGPSDPEKDVYLQAAYREGLWRENNNIQFILYGHTHIPLQRPLDSLDGREVIYLNTGTWRNRIVKTPTLDMSPDFIELKQMTYSILYRKDEDVEGKLPNTLSFDIWTGAKKKYYET